MSDYDRRSAMLTPQQREYLRGMADIESGSSHERAVRQRIRQRLRASILDLGLLYSTIEERDLQGAFDDDIDWEEDDPEEVIHIFNQIKPALAVIFGGVSLQSNRNTVKSAERGPNDAVLEMFEDFVGGGIKKMYMRRDIAVENVDVAIDVEFGDSLEELSDRDLSSMPFDRLKQLLESGNISIEEFLSAVGAAEEDIEELIQNIDK